VTSVKPLHVCIVVGRSAHPQAVIDDLWKRASGAQGESGQITGTAVYASGGGPSVIVQDDRLSVAPLEKPGGSVFIAPATAAAGKPGPVGVIGRLLRDNFESRRLARTLAGRADLQEAFRGSDIVVAADLIADRAVWQLRNQTDAVLVHGPVAMVHALRQLVRK
jgi:hypothetical protein